MLEVTEETLLARGPGNLEPCMEPEQPGDRGFAIQERTVLVIAEELAEALDGHRLGILEDASGEAQPHLGSS